MKVSIVTVLKLMILLILKNVFKQINCNSESFFEIIENKNF